MRLSLIHWFTVDSTSNSSLISKIKRNLCCDVLILSLCSGYIRYPGTGLEEIYFWLEVCHIFLWISKLKRIKLTLNNYRFCFFFFARYQVNRLYCLHVIIMSHTRFRVYLHSIVIWMSRNFLLETGAIFCHNCQKSAWIK